MAESESVVFVHMFRLLRHAVSCPLVRDIVAVDLKPEEITACDDCVEIKKMFIAAGYTAKAKPSGPS